MPMTRAQAYATSLAIAPDRLERHELALLVGGRCRACAELLPRGSILRGEPCPLCHEPTAITDHDRSLIVEYVSQRANVRIGLLATLIGVSHIVIGWTPVVSSAVVAASTAWIRFQIVQPAVRIMSPPRARVAVWTARVATSALVAGTLIINELLTLIPFFGVIAKGVISAGEVLLVAWINARYMRWQLDRDEDGLAVGWWEYGILAGSGVVLVGATIGLVAAAVAAVMAAQALAARLFV